MRFSNNRLKKSEIKIDYSIYIIENVGVLNTKLVKKLAGTDFYELRISMGNEYRVILFSIDNENIIEATQVHFLNGFMKKSTKDYQKQLSIAKQILEKIQL